MRQTPLYDKLLEYSKSKLPYHMPGHKLGRFKALEEVNLFKLDNTEAEGMDNLYQADGVIKEAMDLMATFYGAQKSIFITNGSTAGILASILSVCHEGDKLIIARNAHHSVWNALVLAGVMPVYISPEYLQEDDILGQVTVRSVEEALEKYPDVKGALIVSPTYEGIVSDIKGISDILHRKNKVLIVDEAHGAHFVLEGVFPLNSIKCGADLVINSVHKTLPALTQSALLHLCSNRISYDTLIDSLRMIQTSSPSYAMMGLMDYIRDYMIRNKYMLDKQYMTPLKNVRLKLSALKCLKLIDQPSEMYDIGKIIISTKNANLTGYELAHKLSKDYNISVEAALETYIILMTTIADDENSLMKLAEALLEIDQSLKIQIRKTTINDFMQKEVILGQSPRKIYYMDKEWCELSMCEGKVAAKNVMLYPPGIPIICMGETIRHTHLQVIKYLINKVQGIQVKETLVYVNIIKDC